MLDDRKLKVLRAIVTDYISTHEPVGSKSIVERYGLDVSPATIRNDMAVLDEEGYLAQPHTSAGRVPTDKGYRLFVDRLAQVKPLSSAERKAIETFLSGAVDIDDVVHRTVRLLAQVTRQVAMVQYPVSSQAVIKHIELVPLGLTKALVIVIDSAGIVEQRIAGISADDDRMLELRNQVNETLDGSTISQVSQTITNLPDDSPDDLKAVYEAIGQMAGSNPVSEVVVAGIPNLTRCGFEYETIIAPVLEALEEQVVLLKLLGEAVTRPGEVAVRIGQENNYLPLQATSLVASSYGRGQDSYARLGVVGPTHMDYPSAMAAVSAVANYVGRFLAEG